MSANQLLCISNRVSNNVCEFPTFPRLGSTNETGQQSKGTFTVKAGLAQMLKGGIIMDVVNAQQARIAEEAGACAVMALEKVPADIRRDGGVARMADPKVRIVT